MQNISEIKKQLREGDQQFIADVTGFHKDYISMVFNEKRSNDNIIKAALLIIENRKKLIERLKQYDYRIRRKLTATK